MYSQNNLKLPSKKLSIRAGMSAIAVGVVMMGQSVWAQDEVLDTEVKQFSYAIGTKIGEQLSAQFSALPDADVAMILQGINDIVNGNEPLMSADEATGAIQDRQQMELAKAAEEAEKLSASNQVFLDENAAKEGVVVTDSGLQYSVIESGDTAGTSPAVTDTVVVHYQGTLIDGTVFDSSYDRGEPATFSLQSIIPGWTEALQMMKPGDKWAIVLPPELGYGERGAGGTIGPNSVLLFDVELLEVKQSTN